MTKDHEIQAIFNPNHKRVRAPSVVITNDSPNGSFPAGGFTNILHTSNPQIARSDSISQSNTNDTAIEVYLRELLFKMIIFVVCVCVRHVSVKLVC